MHSTAKRNAVPTTNKNNHQCEECKQKNADVPYLVSRSIVGPTPRRDAFSDRSNRRVSHLKLNVSDHWTQS